jgi:hypothetical protein
MRLELANILGLERFRLEDGPPAIHNFYYLYLYIMLFNYST